MNLFLINARDFLSFVSVRVSSTSRQVGETHEEAGRKSSDASWENDISENTEDEEMKGEPVKTAAKYEEDLACPICLDILQLSDMVMKCPTNDHYFHEKCLTKWMIHQTRTHLDSVYPSFTRTMPFGFHGRSLIMRTMNFQNRRTDENAARPGNRNDESFTGNARLPPLQRGSQQQERNSHIPDMGGSPPSMSSATCPVCREQLWEHAAKLGTYLAIPKSNRGGYPAGNDYREVIDERSLFSRALFRIRVLYGLLLSHRLAFLRGAAYIFVFVGGALKGFSLRPWTFAQDVVYFTLPYKLRVITSVGYIVGMLLKGMAIFVRNVRNGVHPARNLSSLVS